MRFLLSFTTGADVEFEIPEADLKRQPETTLSVMSRPRWTGPEGAPEVQRLEAPGTAETSWSDGMGAFVVAWYARTGGNQALELPAPVELEDAVAIADWLLLPLGDLSQITYAAGADIHRDARPARAFIYRSRARGRPKACNADQIKAAATSPRPGARVVVGGRDARARRSDAMRTCRKPGQFAKPRRNQRHHHGNGVGRDSLRIHRSRRTLAPGTVAPRRGLAKIAPARGPHVRYLLPPLADPDALSPGGPRARPRGVGRRGLCANFCADDPGRHRLRDDVRRGPRKTRSVEPRSDDDAIRRRKTLPSHSPVVERAVGMGERVTTTFLTTRPVLPEARHELRLLPANLEARAAAQVPERRDRPGAQVLVGQTVHDRQQRVRRHVPRF